ncbi:UNVERIFIED_CONTAM: hypothetical protein Sradi_4934000 [Sesamum radiatum]|uniref:Uncharacterized protein n=1 Tax=Sesamum radiatum TaxID=300843 RepID=A0AAW2MEQ2_SESRA
MPKWEHTPSKKYFHFEVVWLQDDECEPIISRTWRDSGLPHSTTTLEDKISSISSRLATWGRMFGREARERIEILERSLISFNRRPLTEGTKKWELKLKEELTKLITQEEVFWK